MTDPVISVEQLCFGFNAEPLLHEISFALEAGEFLAIMGPNGVGKTTLLKCISGIYTPRSGAVLLGSKPAASLSRRQIATMLSYVPQSLERVFPYTVFEFVMMGRYPHLARLVPPGKSDQTAVFDALELTETRQFVERPLTELSRGELQRVLLAAAVAQDTEIILLDEPLTALDPKYQQAVANLLQELKDSRKRSIISTTHDINYGVLLADRVLGLSQGQIVFEGQSEDFITEETLQQVYGCDFQLVQHPKHQLKMVIPA